jgi:hypothetical protein
VGAVTLFAIAVASFAGVGRPVPPYAIDTIPAGVPTWNCETCREFAWEK